MSRRHAAEKRVIMPDIKYNSVLITKLINSIMVDGKKSLAEGIIYKALDRIENKHKVDPFNAFNDAIANVKPNLELNTVRVGGANYQVPIHVDERRGYTLACRFIIEAATKRSERSMIEKLSEELFEASNNRGGAVKKKEDTHKMAQANQAFAHFAVRAVR